MIRRSQVQMKSYGLIGAAVCGGWVFLGMVPTSRADVRRPAAPSNLLSAQPEGEDKKEEPKTDSPKPVPPNDAEAGKKPDDGGESEALRRAEEMKKTRDARKAKAAPKPTADKSAAAANKPSGGRPEVPAGTPGESPAGAAGEPGASLEINIPPAEVSQSNVPPEERMYSFSLKDVTYEQLMAAVARYTGLGVIGRAPADEKTSFVTDEVISFKEMLSRVRMLLFLYKPHEPYWLEYKKNHLEVMRVNDKYRQLETNQMFQSVEQYRAAGFPKEELALVVYTPKSGSIADLREVRNFLPDYVRVTPQEGRNSLIIFGLVRDIDKYLDLADFFGGHDEDPRSFQEFKVEHLLASDAVAKLQTMMELDKPKAGGSPAPRAGGRGVEPNPLENIPEPDVMLLPDDGLRRILVRAMQDKIKEIEFYLPIIDVALPASGYDPVILEVQHADCAELTGTIQQILSASPDAGATTPSGVPKPAKKKTKGAAPQGGAAQPASPAVPVKMEEITLIPHAANNTIIVLADPEGVERVRNLVAMFDVETEFGPIAIPVQHLSATEMATAVVNVLGSEASQPGMAFKLAADRSEDKVWFTGSKKDLERVKSMVASFDVPEVEAVVHTARLQYQKPSFVAQMLRALESTDTAAPPAQPQAAPSTPAKKGGKKARAAVRIADPSKFTPDDETNRLYVLCTDDEWSHYSKIIEELELAAKDEKPVYVKLPLRHLAAEQAIDRLTPLLASDGSGHTRYAPAEGGIMVIGATPLQVAEMTAILEELDRPLNVVERTFDIQHADPADVESLLTTLLGDANAAREARPKTRRSQKPEDNAPVVVEAPTGESAGLTIARLGNRLVVRTSPEIMARVVELVAQFDVETAATQVRTYNGFSPTADLEHIADTLGTVFVGAASPGAKSSKKRVEMADGPRFIPQQAAGKLVVIAETSMYPRIEELIEILRAGGTDSDPIVTRAVDLKYREASELVESLEQLLQLKVRQLEVTGGLAEPSTETTTDPKNRRKPKAAVSRDQRYHVVADDGARRVIIAAPQVIMDEALALVAELDSPVRVAEDTVFQTVPLKNAEASEMVQAIRDLMGTGTTPKVAKKSGKKDGGAATVDLSEVPMQITEVPGGKALVLHGSAKDVEQAIRWIEDLDSQSIPGRVIKVYEVKYADVDRLANLIMAVADIPDKPAAGKARPKGAKGTTEAVEEEDEEEFTTRRELVGSEVYIQADLLSKTMIVAASQAKLAQIDPIVARFNKPPEESGELGMAPEQPVPKFIYELKYKSGFDAAWDLETLLEGVWEPSNELPKVKEASFGDALIIRYPHEDRFEEIRGLIEKYVDKPKKEDAELKRRVFVPPGEMSPKAAAEWLKVHLPNLEVEVVVPPEQKQDDFGVEQIKPHKQAAASPCVLPTAFGRSAQALAAATLLQPPDEPEPEPEPEPAVDLQTQMMLNMQMQMLREQAAQSESGIEKDKVDETKKSKSSAGGKVKILVDPEKGVFVIEAPKGVLEDIEDGMKDLEEEIKDLPEKPDIRIYRVRHIDVHTAEEILNEMFNTPRAQQQAGQAQMAMMQRMQQMQQMQQMRQQGQQANAQGAGKDGQAGAQPAAGQTGGRGAQQPGLAALGGLLAPPSPTQVRVVANPRDRTLILRASTSQYPEILELLATIDQPKPIDSELKVFPLDKLNAVEVEGVLKEMLGLDQPATTGGRRRASAAGVPGASSGSVGDNAGTSLPRRIEASPVTGVLPLTVDPKDVRITSNEETNSILVMAPKEAIQYIGDLIHQLENQDIPERITKHYALKFADVLEVSDYLTEQFTDAKSVVRGGRSRRRGGTEAAAAQALAGGGGVNSPTFVAYARLNMLSVQATAEQIQEIDELVATLDVRAPEEKIQSIRLAHADAKEVADTLTTMFGGTGTPAGTGVDRRARAGAGATGPRFIGEEGKRIVFFTAPESLYDPILEAVSKIEEQSKGSDTVRIIELRHAVPSDVADAIETAYGSSRRSSAAGSSSGRGGRSGGSSASGPRFTVTANDASKRLFVVADDEMFTKVESLAKNLDQERKIGFDFRVYPLKFANARNVFTRMNKLVTDYMRMLGPQGKNVEPFSVDVDDQSNSLVVLGGPVVFGFVEDSLKTIDVPGALNPVGFFMTVLKNGDATEVAGNITRLWAQKSPQQGETAPTVEANRTTNAIIVRGTQSQIDEIKKQFLEPLEQQAPPLKTETITLIHGNAEVVAESIKRIFDDKKAAGAAVGKNVSPAEMAVAVTPDVNTNQIIVQASDANLVMIKERVAQLDRAEIAGGSVTTTKTHTLKWADPNTVANIITQWARDRATTAPGGRVAPRDKVTALAEPATQSVVVTANESNHKLIDDMIKDVDSNKAVVDRTTVVYPLRNADPNALVQAIGNAFRPDGTRRPRPEDQVQASVETATQSIIVTASAKNHEAVKSMIEKSDISPEADRQHQAHVVNLKNADAEAVSRTLNEIFVRTNTRPQGSQGPPVTISALPGSKALLVKCKGEDFTRIQEVVHELDSEEVSAGEEVRVVPVLYGDATEMQTALQEYLKKPGQQGGRGSPLVGDVRVSVLATGNALVVSGDKAEVEGLEATIKRLDTATEKGSVPQIIPLKHARATQLLASVQQIFENPPGGGQRRNQPPPVIVADETLNVLVVRGGQTDVAAIRGMVEQLDTVEQAERKDFRIVKVAAGMNLTKLADDVESAVNEIGRAQASVGGGRGGARQTPEVTITPNSQTRTLLVSGTPTLFDQVEEIVREYEKMGPQAGETATAIFRPKNVTAEEVQALIEQLTEQDGTGARTGRRSGGSGSSPRPPSQTRPRRTGP